MATEAASQKGSGNPEDFLEPIIDFPDGSRFERLAAITDFRKDPGEARILYVCRRIDPNIVDRDPNEEFILKVKAQWPGPQELIHAGPSPHTAAELKALQLFRDHRVEGVPHLVTWKKAVQSHDGVHPEGYLILTIMTKVPGRTLWDMGYWSIPSSARTEIQQAFIQRLRQVRALGIAPYDCALRNVLWDAENKSLSIVDFEHYRETITDIDNKDTELERWGLKSRPVPGTWFVEWGLKAKEAKEIGIVEADAGRTTDEFSSQSRFTIE